MPKAVEDRANCSQASRYCVWIVERGDWRPAYAADVPPRLRTIELALDHSLGASAADAYIAGFNEQAQADALPYWAVRVALSECWPRTISQM